MLRTLFGDFAPRRMPVAHDPDETAHVPLDADGHALGPAVARTHRGTSHGSAVDVVVDVSPAGATLAIVGVSPWLITSSNGTFIAVSSAIAAVTLARAWYLEYIGRPRVARIPMIATTTSNSIRVKPF